MFHYFQGIIKTFGDEIYIINEQAGIQIHYKNPVITKKTKWDNIVIPASEPGSSSDNSKILNQVQDDIVARSLFLHPYIDENHKTIRYYAFDTHTQKQVFEKLIKITGIGPKTGFHIAQIPEKDIQKAIKELNIKFFQNIPGIWPKSAKKILFELKDTIKQADLKKLAVDDKLLKKITSTLKWLGYEARKINDILHKYDKPITEDNLGEVIKWIIKEI